MAQAFVPIPQEPIGETYTWRDWLEKLSIKVFGNIAQEDIPLRTGAGGTGRTSYTVGDVLYCDSTNHLTVLGKPSQRAYLSMNSSGVPSWVSIPYGQFYSTASQSAGVADTVYTVNIDTQDGHNGMSLSSNAITVTQAGYYNLMFSCEFVNTGTSIANVALWPVINGTDVPWSATSTAVPSKHGTSNGYMTIAANFFLTLNSGDVVTMRWVTDTTTCSIFANSTPPPFTAPFIPGIVVTLNLINPA